MKYLRDLAERVGASFVGGVLAAWGTDWVSITDIDWKTALGVGGLAGVVSLLKGLLAKLSGNPESASLSTKV